MEKTHCYNVCSIMTSCIAYHVSSVNRYLIRGAVIYEYMCGNKIIFYSCSTHSYPETCTAEGESMQKVDPPISTSPTPLAEPKPSRSRPLVLFGRNELPLINVRWRQDSPVRKIIRVLKASTVTLRGCDITTGSHRTGGSAAYALHGRPAAPARGADLCRGGSGHGSGSLVLHTAARARETYLLTVIHCTLLIYNYIRRVIGKSPLYNVSPTG